VRLSSNVTRFYLLAFFIWLADFLTKSWAVENFSRAATPVLGNFLQVTLHKNPGAAFSMATEFTVVLTAISTAVALYLLRIAPRIQVTSWVIAAGFLLGGVMGNLSDRYFRAPGSFQGHVIDWIKLPNWPIFNLADSAIVIAAVMAFFLTVKNIHPLQSKSARDEK
jgi:signal peptidase II